MGQKRVRRKVRRQNSWWLVAGGLVDEAKFRVEGWMKSEEA